MARRHPEGRRLIPGQPSAGSIMARSKAARLQAAIKRRSALCPIRLARRSACSARISQLLGRIQVAASLLGGELFGKTYADYETGASGRMNGIWISNTCWSMSAMLSTTSTRPRGRLQGRPSSHAPRSTGPDRGTPSGRCSRPPVANGDGSLDLRRDAVLHGGGQPTRRSGHQQAGWIVMPSPFP